MNWLEILGYVGSVVVAVSLMMKNIVKLRWWNLIGAALFSLYGLLVGAYPVFAVNFFIAIVDVYYLVVLYKKQDEFSLVSVRPNNNYLKKFTEFYSEDILRFFPDFSFAHLEGKKVFFILRNLLPVGLFAFEISDDNSAVIYIDYAVPSYRDLNNAKFLYKTEPEFFKKLGCEKIITHSNVEAHKKYLLKIGFTEDKNKNEFIMKV
jgi:hypothetical protein